MRVEIGGYEQTKIEMCWFTYVRVIEATFFHTGNSSYNNATESFSRNRMPHWAALPLWYQCPRRRRIHYGPCSWKALYG